MILLWPARVKVSLRGTDEMIGVLALVFAIPLGSAFLWLARCYPQQPPEDRHMTHIYRCGLAIRRNTSPQKRSLNSTTTMSGNQIRRSSCAVGRVAQVHSVVGSAGINKRAVLIRSVQLRSVVRACPGHASRRFFLRIHTFLQ